MLFVKGIKDQNINLAKLKKFTGEVISTGERTRYSKQNAKVFFVSLKGLDQLLGVYRMSENYDDLVKQIEQGDTLTVYYRSDSSNEINIDLVQIDKNGMTVLDKKEFEDKESTLIFVGFIGGLTFAGLSIYNYKKHLTAEKKNAG